MQQQQPWPQQPRKQPWPQQQPGPQPQRQSHSHPPPQAPGIRAPRSGRGDPTPGTGRERAPRRSRSAPSWPRDLLRVVLCCAAAAAGATFLLLLGRLGLLRHSNRYSELIPADPVLVGILAALIPLLLVFLLLETNRADLGFRVSGRVSLLLTGTLCAALLQTAVMTLWPLLLGSAAPGSNAAELGTNAASILVVLAFVLAVTAWFWALVLGLISWPVWGSAAMVLPFLGGIAFFMFMGPQVLEAPASVRDLVLWAGAAALGMLVLSAVGGLTGRQQRRREAA